MPNINNDFYDELGDAWWNADDHMVTFLRAETEIRVDYILKNLPTSDKPLKILDLGSGGGLISIPLARLGHHITAVDLSETSLQVLRNKAVSENITDRIQTLKADILQPLPFKNQAEKFDVVLIMDVLEHVPTPKTVIQNAQQYLKPGGIFIYHTLNKTWVCWLIYLQIAPRLIKNSPDHVHVYQYCIKPEWMSEGLQELGFSNHEQIGIFPKLNLKLIWHLLTQRKLESMMPFDYCQSLMLGYLGHASLVKTESPLKAELCLQ